MLAIRLGCPFEFIQDTAADLADLADPVDPGVVAVPEPNGAANVVCVLGGPGAGKSTQCNKALAAGVNMEFYSVRGLHLY